MPTYQYACTEPECGHRFELVQSFTDPAASTCPVCGGAVRKVFSAVGVVFKGSGFYRTDSRESGNGAKRSSGSASDSSAATPASSGSSSSESSSGSSASSTSGSSTSGASGSGSSGSSVAAAS